MAAQTGRTVFKYVKVQIGDTSNVLRDLPLVSMGDIGPDYEQVDASASAEEVIGFLANRMNGEIDLVLRYDSVAAQAASGSAAAPTFSGSTTVINPLVGVNTPRTLAIYVGMRHVWETGEPVWGLQRSGTTSGYIVTSAKVNLADGGTMSVHLSPFAGTSAPTWGTAILTA